MSITHKSDLKAHGKDKLPFSFETLQVSQVHILVIADLEQFVSIDQRRT